MIVGIHNGVTTFFDDAGEILPTQVYLDDNKLTGLAQLTEYVDDAVKQQDVVELKNTN